jgi:hypothetical protein
MQPECPSTDTMGICYTQGERRSAHAMLPVTWRRYCKWNKPVTPGQMCTLHLHEEAGVANSQKRTIERVSSGAEENTKTVCNGCRVPLNGDERSWRAGGVAQGVERLPNWVEGPVMPRKKKNSGNGCRAVWMYLLSLTCTGAMVKKVNRVYSLPRPQQSEAQHLTI